jgi:hypothetical protein
VLFGRETSGLSNDELQRCHCHLQIPANPDYPSLNLAMAVQVVCYELYKQSEAAAPQLEWDRPPATQAQLEGLMGHLQAALSHCGFLDADNPGQTMTRLRRLFTRVRLDDTEVQMLRGALLSWPPGRRPRTRSRSRPGSGRIVDQISRVLHTRPMRLTTKGRYAVTAMLDIALHHERGPVSVAEVAERQGISSAYLEQLFSKLKRAGLLRSVRGPGGGYELARPGRDQRRPHHRRRRRGRRCHPLSWLRRLPGRRHLPDPRTVDGVVQPHRRVPIGHFPRSAGGAA